MLVRWIYWDLDLDLSKMIFLVSGHLVPQSSQGHQRPLGNKDERGGRGLLQNPIIHRPQAREDPEEGRLATPVRSGYKHMLSRQKGEREAGDNDITIRRHNRDSIQHKLI